MAFHVFPDPPVAPFHAAAAGASGDASEYLAVPELAGLTPEAGKPLFFVRVASNVPPADAPSVWLKVTNTAAGTSAEGEVDATHTSTNPIQVGDGTNPGVVNAVYAGPDEHGVVRVSVYTFIPGLTFEVKVQNRASEPRELVWVVATSELESQQPWIDAEPFVPVPDEIPADDSGVAGFKRFRHTFRIPVVNRGTGPLKMTDEVGMPLGHYMTRGRADPIAPNSTGEVEVRFEFATGMPDILWVERFIYRLDSNDPLATEQIGHRNKTAIGPFTRWKQVMTSASPALSETADAKGELPPAQTAGEEETPSEAVAPAGDETPEATPSTACAAENPPARKRKTGRRSSRAKDEAKVEPVGE